MTQQPRTTMVVLGIDAANPTLLVKWAAQGILPNIGSLIDRGLLATSRSLDGFYVGSTWPSLYTGVSPAKHGFHYSVQLKSGTYDLHRPSAGAFVHREPFWTSLSRAGRRMAILDVPLSRLDSSLNGVQVVEWGGHDAVFGFCARPRELEAHIRTRFGEHPAGSDCDAARRTVEDYEAFIDSLVRGANTKAALTVDLLRAGDWDLLMQVFTEAHCAGHQCWHLSDPSHPAHDPSVTAVLGDPLQRVYAAIDGAIGRIRAAAGDALLVLVVGHGMSYRFGANFLLRSILVRLGVTAPPVDGRARSRFRDLATPIWRRLPQSLRGLVRRAPITGGRPDRPDRLEADPRWSRCFPVGNGLAVGGIRLNLKGREPQGLLDPGPVADAFCDSLTHDLLDIIDDRTRRPLVRRVLRTAALYRGERLDDLPDLLVEWSDEVATGSSSVGCGRGAAVRAHSARLGTVEGTNHYGRTGEHRPEGLLVATGPGIQPGRLDRVVSILDFAPTVAAILGVSLPDCDGRVLTEFLPRPGAIGAV